MMQTVAELVRIKKQDWNGYCRARDADGLSTFLNDEFTLLEADGTVSGKAEAVDYVRSNEWPLASRNFVYTVMQVQFASEDIANVFGRGTFDSAECRMGYTSSNILRRKEDGWHPIFSQTSPAACIDPEESDQ
ncbi:MAG: nuclear transport factor 2 family protein [Erythrobacter sp.]|jgi:hypothetical protein|nr:nuclear transport factor 2 family protein [Erythrobacter sp.]